MTGETPRESNTGSESTGAEGTADTATGHGEAGREGGRGWRAQRDGEARAQIGTGKDC